VAPPVMALLFGAIPPALAMATPAIPLLAGAALAAYRKPSRDPYIPKERASAPGRLG
jgi:hypothetical protein